MNFIVVCGRELGKFEYGGLEAVREPWLDGALSNSTVGTLRPYELRTRLSCREDLKRVVSRSIPKRDSGLMHSVYPGGPGQRVGGFRGNLLIAGSLSVEWNSPKGTGLLPNAVVNDLPL